MPNVVATFPVPAAFNEAMGDTFDDVVVYAAVGGGYAFTYSGSTQNPGLFVAGSGVPFATVEAARDAALDAGDAADIMEAHPDTLA